MDTPEKLQADLAWIRRELKDLRRELIQVLAQVEVALEVVRVQQTGVGYGTEAAAPTGDEGGCKGGTTREARDQPAEGGAMPRSGQTLR